MSDDLDTRRPSTEPRPDTRQSRAPEPEPIEAKEPAPPQQPEAPRPEAPRPDAQRPEPPQREPEAPVDDDERNVAEQEPSDDTASGDDAQLDPADAGAAERTDRSHSDETPVDSVALDDAVIDEHDAIDAIPDVQPDPVAEPIDATANAGADQALENRVPDVGIPDADQPEAEPTDGAEQVDPTADVAERIENHGSAVPDNGVEDRLDDFGGAPSPPTESDGTGAFDADDPFNQDFETDRPDLGKYNEDPFRLDVDAPAAGLPHSGQSEYDVMELDSGSFYVFAKDGSTDTDMIVTKKDDGNVEVELDDGTKVELPEKDLEKDFGVDIPGDEPPPAEVPADEPPPEAPQTELDRLEMRAHQVIDWLFGSGDTDDDPAGDRAPESDFSAPGTIDFSDPNFQHKVSERDGAITWGDHDSGLDGSSTGTYDGVDYGGEAVDPDIPIEEATEMIVGSPMDQPDVDPTRFDTDDAFLDE